MVRCTAVSVFGCSGVCESDPRFILFALASCYAVHISALSIYNESVHRLEQHRAPTSGINTIP